MMEEVSDDTNGESTFEFVGDKADDPAPKEPVTSSSQGSNTSAFPATPPPSSSPVISSPSSATPSSVSQLFAASPAGSFLAPAAPAPLANVSSPQIVPSADTTAATPVPMYNPAQPVGIPSSFTSPQAYNLMSPMQVESTAPYVPPGQGYAAPSTAYTTPPAAYTTPPTPFNTPPAAYTTPPGMSQAALELPVDDNFVSSSSQPYQENTTQKGMWGWIKGNEFLNKVAEKAKNSVDTVITTLDPGMKEIIYSGGDINIIVATNSEVKVSAVREAFQQVFNKATVEGVPSQSTSIAPQPVGFSAGLKAAEERISNLRQQGLVPEDQVIVAVENFLAEFTPDRWFDLGCILLQDPRAGVTLQVYTQAIPVDMHYVMQAKQQTPPDYPLGWSGFAITIGQVLGSALGVHHSTWHQALTGVPRRDIILLAAKSIAGMYKNQLKR